MNISVSSILGSVAGVVLIALAGCSTASETPQVASADRPVETSTSAGAVPSTPAKESDYDKALRYTRCMTDNGVTLPDPVEGKPLSMTDVTPEPGKYVQIDMTAFDACKQFLPATWPVKWSPEDIARYRPFGECMKAEGMEWPEPDANGMVNDRTDPTAPRSAEYRAAEDKCRYLIPD